MRGRCAQFHSTASTLSTTNYAQPPISACHNISNGSGAPSARTRGRGGVLTISQQDWPQRFVCPRLSSLSQMLTRCVRALITQSKEHTLDKKEKRLGTPKQAWKAERVASNAFSLDHRDSKACTRVGRARQETSGIPRSKAMHTQPPMRPLTPTGPIQQKPVQRKHTAVDKADHRNVKDS